MGEENLSSETVKIVNRLGLHARAAGKLVNTIHPFKAAVTVEKDGHVAPADSVMELMMLTAGPGDTVTVRATGPEAGPALNAAVTLIEQGFGEEV